MLAFQTPLLCRFSRLIAAAPAMRPIMLYVAGAALVAGLAMAGQMISQRSAARRMTEQHVLNVAGQQRVLGQRMVATALRIQANETGPERMHAVAELAELTRSWDHTHYSLRHGDAAYGLPTGHSPAIKRMFAELHPKYVGLSQAAHELVNYSRPAATSFEAMGSSVDKTVARLLRHERSTLECMERIVFQWERESQARAAQSMLWQQMLLVLTLVAIGLQGALAVIPLARQHLRSLQRIRQLESELAEARLALKRPAQAPVRNRQLPAREVLPPRLVERVAAVA
jgi:lambda repressor-like predicted transcriptional regulator